MSRKRPRQSIPSHVEFEMDTSDDNCDELVAIPNPDNSGCSSDSDSDFESNDHLSSITYKQASENYTDNQCKLEGDHQYKWMVGEKSYPNETEDKLLLTDGVKKSIQKSEPIQLFEKFFCMEMKTYIIDSCKENGFELQLDDLNTFIGIIIVSSFNKRKSQRDYWSSDPFLLCEVVSSAMQRDTFEKIKSELKYSMPKDNDPSDKAWRVRKLLQLFQRNIRQFGLWKTALSVDEMMAKSYARTSLKQFIRGKPIRFGLKFWGLCTADGYLLNLDLYCGKNSSIGDKLGKCALGSRVVMELLDPFLKSIPPKKISQFHLYCDNFFTNFDLLVHLKKLGLQCTGTIRENRVKEKNVIDKKSPRGTYVVKHDQNSGINYITIVDSKPVSIASTAAGVTPLLPSKRFSSSAHSKIEIPFPQAFHLYNKFMGGVDVHDGHCNNLLPSIRSKKWTWVVFIRFIQAAIVNSVVIFNATGDKTKKIGSKQFAISIAKYYLERGKLKRNKAHDTFRHSKQARCSICPIRTYTYCKDCNAYFCSACMKAKHVIRLRG